MYSIQSCITGMRLAGDLVTLRIAARDSLEWSPSPGAPATIRTERESLDTIR